jgi:endoglucanase
MRQHQLSWANWSYCDKDESSAALVPKAYPEDGISRSELSKSGRYVFSKF